LYDSLHDFIPTSIVGTKNNDLPPASFKPEFLPIMGNSVLRYANPLLLLKIRKVMKERQSTHLAMEHPYFGWLGILAKWIWGTKLIIRSQNIEALRFKSMGKPWWRLLWLYERFTHRMANLNFFITEDDHQYALTHFKLDPKKCFTITYGFDLAAPPTPEEKKNAKLQLLQTYGLPEDSLLLFFNGALDYAPNEEALDMIVKEINPLLMKQMDCPYTIIICGKNLPERFGNLESEKKNNMVYAGFVEDISLYFKGTDIFINPVIEGGGIKTKLVEALGNDLSSISTRKGATGVPEDITGGKMKMIEDKDWATFASSIQSGFPQNLHIPETFFSYFYWRNIAEKAYIAILEENKS